MNLKYVDLLSLIEFKDRYGIIRSSYGCSLKGLSEFTARIEQLQTILIQEAESNPEITLLDLYQSHDYFRHCCDRILELNQIDPDWLDAKGLLLEALIFSYEGGTALLAQLNQLPSMGGGKPLGPELDPNAELAATIVSLTQSLQQALEIIETHPAKEVIATLDAYERQQRMGDEKSRREEWAKERRRQAKERAEQAPKPFNTAELKLVNGPIQSTEDPGNNL